MKLFKFRSRLAIVLVIAAFAGIGAILITGSQAATPFVATEPENGTIVAPATKLADTTASGGSAVLFGGAPTPTPPGTVTLARPTAAILSSAMAASLSYFGRNTTTNDLYCTPCDAAPVLLAANSYAGDNSSDARLLAQMRTTIVGGKDPFGNGTYVANDERNISVMYALAKLTPRVWSQLTATEVIKIDLVMKGMLIGSLWETADKTASNGSPPAFTGETGNNRDYNPNYREGMIGGIIPGTLYFGGRTATDALINSFDYVAFADALQTNGLNNMYWVYGTFRTSPGAGAPTPAAVQTGIKDYRAYGMHLGQLQDIYTNLVNDSFGQVVTCGLNNGAGIKVGSSTTGLIVAGCASLPNKGAVGMAKEFNSVDAGGARSSGTYVRLGTRTNLFNQLALVAYGQWQTTATSATTLAKVKVGVTDFFYKSTQGYRGYSKGADEGVFNCSDFSCPMNEAIWTQILAKYHGI